MSSCGRSARPVREMRAGWKHTVLWLFVINLGIAFGAGLYEARVVIPQWANIPPKDGRTPA